MKRILVILGMFTLLISCSTEKNNLQPFTINGNIEGAPDGMVYMQVYAPGYKAIVIDSAKIKDGVFEFTGKINKPKYYYLRINDKQRAVNFFVEPGSLTVEGSWDDLKNIKVTGSKTQDEFDAFYTELENRRKEMREQGVEEEELYEKRAEMIRKYVAEHPASVISAHLTYWNLVHEVDLAELKTIVSELDESLNSTFYLQQLKERIKTLEQTAVGQPALDFTMENTEGEPVSLSSFEGDYLFVDFWASWCMPCRRENPNVVKMYRKYHSEGFDILGVSFDSNRDNWLKAIEEDSLTWTHVSDLQGWQNAAGRLYDIRSIPSSLLIDPEGIIIAKNLRGEDLRNKLADIFEK
ncbi:DUF4369 domain-containing protein [candidate division KSB1 bacterium]|nr:DUF4369 domain-containing protein [candidate division KSB1 bacterium]